MIQQLLAVTGLSGAGALAIIILFMARYGYHRAPYLPRARRTWVLFAVGGEFLVGAILFEATNLAFFSFQALPHLPPWTPDALAWGAAACAVLGIVTMLTFMWQVGMAQSEHRDASDSRLSGTASIETCGPPATGFTKRGLLW